MSAAERLNVHGDRCIDLLDDGVTFIAFGGDVAVLVPIRTWNRYAGCTPPAPGTRDELADLRYREAKFRGLAIKAIGALEDGSLRRHLVRQLERLGPDDV